MGDHFPRIPGHEIVGEVVATGPGVTQWKHGARVGGGWHGGHCFECVNCRKGDFVVCKNETVNGIFRDGGYGQYATLRSEAVAAIPEGLDSAEAGTGIAHLQLSTC
jgi:D-arabinose 1-dehydrogenase-like Zn-dependent alcohol dehydrogenase